VKSETDYSYTSVGICDIELGDSWLFLRRPNMWILRKGRSRVLLLIPALAVGGSLLACSSSPKMTPLMEYAGVTETTTAELRIRMHEFAVRYPVIIEEAAYKIVSGTEDPQVLKKALLWKIYAIPAYNKAMFRVDPFAALIDTWAVTVQMRDYFESGPGAGSFGDLQHHALDATQGMENELIYIATRALGEDGVKEAKEDIYAWAREHPIQSHFFVRDSVIPLVAHVMAGSNRGWIEDFESLQENLQELRLRLTIYTDFIPRQVMWQLELASIGLIEDVDVQTALRDISELRAAISRTDSSLTSGFDRTAGSIDDVNYSISGGFDRLGETLLSGIHTERIEALAGLSSDMEPVLEDLRNILDEGAATYEARTKAVVAYIFWRGLLVVAAFFAALTIYRLATRGVRS
jgi:hypothetical protein